MAADRLLRWHEGRAIADTEPAAPRRVLVADSFRVESGRVLALATHRDRFLSSVLAKAPELRSDAEGLWAAALAAVPLNGSWFPRVEVVADASGSLVVRAQLRRAPALERTVVVATADTDPRTEPLVKGPDLDALGLLRARAAERGAGEAIILSPDGLVVEGAYSSMVWWRGDVLCLPSADLARLPGVTVRVLLTLAAALGVEAREEASAPADLDGVDLWSLGALHGIRTVSSWIDGPALATTPQRAALWRERLTALRRPSDPG